MLYLVSRKPAFSLEKLEKHGFESLINFLEGYGANGWRGVQNLSVEEVYDDVVSIRSAKEAVVKATLEYKREKDNSQGGWIASWLWVAQQPTLNTQLCNGLWNT